MARSPGRCPDRFSRGQVRRYLIYSVEVRSEASGAYGKALSAMSYFYRLLLKRGDLVEDIFCPRLERRLPVVLCLMTTYSTVLRIVEAVRRHVNAATRQGCRSTNLQVLPSLPGHSSIRSTAVQMYAPMSRRLIRSTTSPLNH